MLADYPVIVDYNLSPLTSPLFDRESLLFGHSDEILLSGNGDGLGGLNSQLSENTSLSDQIPLLLNDDDDVSSLSASIQYSDPIDGDDDLGDILDDGIDLHHVCVQDCSISEGGDTHEARSEDIFGNGDSNYLNSNYLGALHDTTLAENVSLDILDPVDSDLGLCIGRTIEVADCDSSRSKVKDNKSSSSRKRRQKKTEDKTWSEMNAEEKEKVAESLSSVLRTLLGPRERMEVLAMISSDKFAGLNDKDFVIEPRMLNEMTLAKLESFLEENEVSAEVSDSELIRSAPEKKRGHSNGGRRKCSSLPASPLHQGSCAKNSSVVSKKQSNRQKPSRAWRRKTRKEYRQASKERRSGLFHQEEVLSLSRNIDDDEEEIDILE